MEELTFSIEELPGAARAFIDSIGEDRVFLFSGEMGAGKTTFIAEVCRQLGADDDFGSPTFSIINEYADASGKPIYHFDFYRLETPREVMEIGADEYLNSGELCFIEWPDRLASLTPVGSRIVTISVEGDGKRKVSFGPDQRWR